MQTYINQNNDKIIEQNKEHAQKLHKYNSVAPLKSDSHLPKRAGEKCFLFHLKIFFRSQDILNFFLTFWSCKNTA